MFQTTNQYIHMQLEWPQISGTDMNWSNPSGSQPNARSQSHQPTIAFPRPLGFRAHALSTQPRIDTVQRSCTEIWQNAFICSWRILHDFSRCVPWKTPLNWTSSNQPANWTIELKPIQLLGTSISVLTPNCLDTSMVEPSRPKRRSIPNHPLSNGRC